MLGGVLPTDGNSSLPVGRPYTYVYYLHVGGIGCIALASKDKNKKFRQRLLPLNNCLQSLSDLDENCDWYLSPNAFRPGCRRRKEDVVSVRATWLDLDYYKSGMEELAVEEVWERAAQLLDVRGIPHPQMVVATGRGLQLLWLYRKGQPAQIAPRWMAVQRELIELFSDFGPDGSASRLGGVLRLPGTVNQKSGVRSHFVHFDPDTRFDFEDLQRAILPVPRPKYVREPSRNDQRARSAKPPPQAEANRRMASLVVQDIERLMQGRGPGYRRETSCDASLFIYGHYLLRAVGRNVFWERFMTCARAIGDVSVEQRRAIAKSVIAFKHRYSTEGAAADLGVTEDEVHKFKLQRLQPAGEKNDREKRQRHLERGRQQKAGARRAQGHRPQTESLSATKPWALMGVSRSTYYRHCTKT